MNDKCEKLNNESPESPKIAQLKPHYENIPNSPLNTFNLSPNQEKEEEKVISSLSSPDLNESSNQRNYPSKEIFYKGKTYSSTKKLVQGKSSPILNYYGSCNSPPPYENNYFFSHEIKNNSIRVDTGNRIYDTSPSQIFNNHQKISPLHNSMSPPFISEGLHGFSYNYPPFFKKSVSNTSLNQMENMMPNDGKDESKNQLLFQREQKRSYNEEEENEEEEEEEDNDQNNYCFASYDTVNNKSNIFNSNTTDTPPIMFQQNYFRQIENQKVSNNQPMYYPPMHIHQPYQMHINQPYQMPMNYPPRYPLQPIQLTMLHTHQSQMQSMATQSPHSQQKPHSQTPTIYPPQTHQSPTKTNLSVIQSIESPIQSDQSPYIPSIQHNPIPTNNTADDKKKKKKKNKKKKNHTNDSPLKEPNKTFLYENNEKIVNISNKNNVINSHQSNIIKEKTDTCNGDTLELNNSPNKDSQAESKPKKKSKKKIKKIEPSLYINSSIEELSYNIVNLSKDQAGCRHLQKVIDEKEHTAIALFYPALKPHLNEISNDAFGNYLIQKIFPFLLEKDINDILSLLSPNIFSLGASPFGTRVIQKLIDYLTTPQLIEHFLQIIKPETVNLIKELNGTHIINKILESYPNHSQFIYDLILKEAISIATNRHGCCVLQKYLTDLDNSFCLQLIELLLLNCQTLAVDQYGNYIIQSIMKIKDINYNNSIAQQMMENLIYYSKHKHSSNIVEKCFEFCDKNIINQLLSQLSSRHLLHELLLDEHGNYVVQRIIASSNPEEQEEILKYIAPFFEELKVTSYGEKIIEKLIEMYPILTKFVDSSFLPIKTSNSGVKTNVNNEE